MPTHKPTEPPALLALARETARAFQADGGQALSAALVYYSTLSFVPLLIFVVALPGLILRFVNRQAGERLVAAIEEVAGPLIGGAIVESLDRLQSPSLLVAGVSAAMLLFSASSAFRFLRYAFRWIWREDLSAADTRLARLRETVLGRTVDFLIAFGLVLAAPLLVLAGLLIFSLSLMAGALLRGLPIVGDTVLMATVPIALVAIYAGIYLLLLWVLPPVRLRWREILLPGLACGVAVLITTYGLGLYLRFFSGASLYGAIGTIFALQIWTYANAVVLFGCAELCKLLVRRRR